MEIKLFTIPNFITLANLICGALAINQVAVNQNYVVAFGLIILAAVFDFFDGFVARLLSQQSEIGLQLDSLSDMVSFGLAPAMILFYMAQGAESLIDCELLSTICRYLPFMVVAFSALRLAKFNIDKSQSSEFIGLPTPACALFCASVALVSQIQMVAIPLEAVALISVVFSLLLVSPIRMFALKFKDFGWQGNELRYLFIAASASSILLLKLYAITFIILLYVSISIVCEVIKRMKA
ncbi:MAG: CDP-diacylglycerol--serine O-phosphatidyltransferase [Rikenellaceae bacterium]